MGDRRPDRVVIINDRSAKVGGASNLAILSAGLLEARGVDVTYFAGDAAADDAKPARDTINLGISPLMQQGKAAALAGGLYNAKAYEAFRELIATADTPQTIYHIHGWSKILSPSIFRALDSVRDRTVLHAHDYFLACPNGGFANYRRNSVCSLKPMSLACLTTQCDKRGYHEKIWRTFRHMLREYYFPLQQESANIVTVHEEMRKYLTNAGIDVRHMETIRNPVDPFLNEATSPWENSDFFFVGRLEAEKGFEDAASAARLANVKLRFVGNGAGRAILEHSYPEVVIHGWQNREGIRSLLKDARALVVSSRVPEPFGLAALEAVSSGIPVILPDSALLAREIERLGCGLAYRAGDCSALADAMRMLASSDALIKEKSANCLREFEKLAHNANSWTDALLALYARILERSSRSLV